MPWPPRARRSTAGRPSHRSERGALLAAVAERLSERGDELAATIATELGMPMSLARLIQVGLPTMTFASMRGLLLEPQAEEEIGNSLVVREPHRRRRRDRAVELPPAPDRRQGRAGTRRRAAPSCSNHPR